MFELKVALKYLRPRRKQLSVALIAFLSVTVISLVVWLVLVFLSVTSGIERAWLEKLTDLNAPIRVTPTSEYYSSYYYQIDALSGHSHYRLKTIGEKALAQRSDPYDPESDREIPKEWPAFDGKDPVKELYRILGGMQGLVYQDFEMSGALLKIEMNRQKTQNFLTQASYVASFADRSPYVQKLLLEKAPSFDVDSRGNQPIILPKSYLDAGVRLGDRGYLGYSAPTASGMLEQRLGIYVAAFYDPGILAVGGKWVLAPHQVARVLNQADRSLQFDRIATNGVQVWFKEIEEVDRLKQRLISEMRSSGIDQYWNVTSYREYDFAKDLLQQFQSDRYLFTMIGAIILMVACCNIISMLVLLVNDKKREIGILQAMGAKAVSIGAIFGICGLVMGIVSSGIGTLAAFFTLRHIDLIVGTLSALQGHQAFQAAFYGANLPTHLSGGSVLFVLIATPLLSLAAALVPAWKACRLKPSAILRSE